MADRELQGSGGGGSLSPIVGRVSLHTLKRPGDILVTKMTSPVHLGQMLKASAIVTDEGGEMCHAAVVCRAENIPYVIGTLDATRTLADGDEITVDPVNKLVRY